MRTSAQLKKTDQCELHPHVNITFTSDAMIKASAQRNVILRVLKGEPIDDIPGEISSILLSKNYEWENVEQKASNLALYKARINRFLAWENGRNHIFPEDISDDDFTVDFFGEQIQALPDYFVVEGDKVYVCKLKTSRFSTEKADIGEYEAYALGLVGEKLFPDKQVVVQYLHLADKDKKKERQAILRSFDDLSYAKIAELRFDEAAKTFFEEKHADEIERNEPCTPEECAECSAYAICHYEEPPISIAVEKSVRPISEIRLTHAQQTVIDYESGTARINAGAGAGKTLVVAMRIVELLKKGYEPEDICLLTFTRAGAEEMTARVVQYCAGNGLLMDPDRLTSTTFNAFCQDLITSHYEELGYTAPPRVLPDEMRYGIINRLIDQFQHIPEWDYTAASSGKFAKFAKGALTRAKDAFAEIKKEGYTRENNPWTAEYEPVSIEILFSMYEEYDRILHARNFVEYDDQILQTFKLLSIHPTLFDEIGYKHIIVDEFQDTDLPQINLLNKIIDTASFKSFMAVGDDSQSIFSFRHTSPEYMINFGDYFGRFDDFDLVENHRSAANIINFANQVNGLVENKVDKDLIATKENTCGPTIQGFYSQKSEYEWIAEQIKRQLEAGRTPSDIAVLMSDRTELTAMASVLTQFGIPSVLMNPVPYVENSRVAALCAFYDSFTNGTTKGLLGYQNALAHGALRGATAEQLEEMIETFGSEVSSSEKSVEAFARYAEALDVEKADECYQDFLEKVNFCTSTEELAEFFRDFELYGLDSRFKREGKYEGVCLTTIHSAKGLEWDVTYLSLSHFDKESYHKNERKFIESGEKDEVLRKWFVGSTRARQELIMTGQFTNKSVENTYVKEAYKLLGKLYDYSFVQQTLVQEAEKEERKKGFNMEAFSLGRYARSARRATTDASGRAGKEIVALYGDHQAPAAPVAARGVTPSLRRGSAPSRQIEDLSAEDIEFA